MFLFQLLFEITQNYTERFNNFSLPTFENHWDLLLRECAKRREKETQIPENFRENTYCPKKHQLRHNMHRKVFLNYQEMDGKSQC